MVDSLYYGNQCPCCSGVSDASRGIRFDEDLLEKVLREIYDEEVKPEDGDIPEDLYEATRDIFEKASATGFANGNMGTEGNEDYLRDYSRSIEVFSAFRVHKYAEMMASKLHDDEGNLRSFQEWKKETASIQSHFNENWLRTEYNTSILRAEQAADWKQFETDKDIMPNLKWMPTSSATPREEHAVFWQQGLTLPIDDKFWDEHHPGDLWNCKCWLEQTDGTPTPKKEMPSKKETPKPASGLKSNPGKKAEMYDRSHPYYPDPKTCLWLKLAKEAKEKGYEAKFGRVVDSVKCSGDCNNCIPFTKWRFKQNKKVFSKQIKKWSDTNLKDVKLDEKNVSKRTVIQSDGYEVIVSKNFLKETFDKYHHKAELDTALSIAMSVKDWLPLAKHVATEDGKHHKFKFEIFTVIYKGHKVKAQVKVTEGCLLYCVKVDEEDSYEYK